MKQKSRLLLMAVASCMAVTLVLRSAPAEPPAENPPYPPPGKSVDVGGYRPHLQVRGDGDPSGVLIAGGGDFSFDWSLVQPTIARLRQGLHPTAAEATLGLLDRLRWPPRVSRER